MRGAVIALALRKSGDKQETGGEYPPVPLFIDRDVSLLRRLVSADIGPCAAQRAQHVVRQRR